MGLTKDFYNKDILDLTDHLLVKVSDRDNVILKLVNSKLSLHETHILNKDTYY